ncbi:MAG TPA: SBBP repeat-containing protein [Pyrinomonadaceae bacterium]|nr:SBBP repeat-containing protein [Pyrinomonadaceae bacterium]
MFTSRSPEKLVASVLACALFCAGLTGVRAEAGRAPENRVPPPAQTAPQAKAVDEATRARVQDAYAKLPLSFEENRGQVDAEVRYVSRGPGYTLFLTQTEAVLSLRGAEAAGRLEKGRPGRTPDARPAARRRRAEVLRMRLKGANPAPVVTAENGTGAPANYFRGNDPKKWRTGAARFEQVRYAEVYPGVDMVYHGEQGQLEYDFEVAPGADTRQIALEFAGARSVKMERATGDLVLKTAGGEEVRQRRPFTYQEAGGARREVASRYVMKGEREVGIEVGDYDRTKPLVIDPVLSYSTLMGSHSSEYGTAIAVDASGIAYVAGFTYSTDFPARNAYQTHQGFSDVFVAKFDTNLAGAASLLYSTYLGGDDSDEASGIAVDAAGIVYVTGYTNSVDFPTLNGYQTQKQQYRQDAFVAKLDTNAAGAASLLYSTYFGGTHYDYSAGIAADSAGNAYIVGTTNSPDLPTLHNFQAKQSDGRRRDAFVARFDTNAAGAASLRYATYFGGNRDDYGAGIALDSAGYAYVVGTTSSNNLPTRNLFQANLPYSDAFVIKLDTNLAGAASLLYSTYLGGNGDDEGNAIAVDQAGCAYVTGQTNSENFPAPNAYQPHFVGTYAWDIFVAKLDTNVAGAASLLYGTYLGSYWTDVGLGIAADSAGAAYVTGYTGSEEFPTLNAYQGRFGDADKADPDFTYDAFVAKLDTLARGEDSLVYSTYLGGSEYDEARAIAVGPAGDAYVTGYTASPGFPMRRPSRRGPAPGWSNNKAFVTRLRETYFIRGRVVRGGESGGERRGVGGVAVTLTGTQSRRVVTDSNGEFTFWNLEKRGSYTITPSKGDLAFGPAGLDFPDLQASEKHVEMRTRTANISGRVTLGAADGPGLGGVTLTLMGGEDFTPRTAKTNSYGAYSFNDLPTPNGYRIEASKTNYLFEPARLTLSSLTASRRNVNLVATLRNYTIGGVISRFGQPNLGGVTVRLESPAPAGFAPRTATTNSAGAYSFPNLPGGRSYTVTVMKDGYCFFLTSQSLVNLSSSLTSVNFYVETCGISGPVSRTGTGP